MCINNYYYFLFWLGRSYSDIFALPSLSFVLIMRQKKSRRVLIGLSCLILICALLLTESLAFVKQPQNVLKGYIGQKLVINCATNDEHAHHLSPSPKRNPKQINFGKSGKCSHF